MKSIEVKWPIVFFVFFLLFQWFPLSAEQNPLFMELYDKEDMLSLKISGIIQDKRGFIWLATQEGLFKYEGLRSHHYIKDLRDENSLITDMIQYMFYDSQDDILWLGTYQGLSEYSIVNGNFTNYPYKNGIRGTLSDSVVTSIIKDSAGQIWIGTLNGLNRLDPETGYIDQISLYPQGTGKEMNDNRNIIRTLLYDSIHDRVWVGTISGLFSFTEGELDIIDEESRFPHMVMRIVDSDTHLILGTWQSGLFKWEKTSGKYINLGFEDINIYTMILSGEKDLWIGSWNQGLFRYSLSEGNYLSYVHNSEDEYGLPHNIIYSLCLDNSGILWIGTNGGGGVRFDPEKEDPLFLKHNTQDENTISAGGVQDLLWDGDFLWIARYGGGIERYDKKTGLIRHYSSADSGGIRNDTAHSLLKDNRDRIMVSHNGGIDYYDSVKDIFLPFYDSNFGIFAFFQDSRGIYWLGENKTGLLGIREKNDEQEVVYHFDTSSRNPISSNIIYFVLEDNDGSLWVGTNNGVNRLDLNDGSVNIYRHDPYISGSLIDNKTRSGFFDSQGRLFVATISGVSLYRPETDSFFNFLYNMPGENGGVYGIQEDFSGNLWFMRKKSLEVYTPQFNFVNRFDKADGISVRSFDPGNTRDRNGRLYFGSPGKIWSFDGYNGSGREIKLPVYLMDFQLFNESVKFDVPVWMKKKIVLDWNDDFFSFEFSALEYGNPEGILYYYRMDGFDKSWIYNGNRNYASYTNLAPGNYTFNVKAVSNKVSYTAETLSIDILITQPPWFSWWAVCLYSLLILIGLYIVISYRRNLFINTKSRGSDNRIQKDPLTGLMSRKGLEMNMNRIWSGASITGNDITVIIVDIDNFKDYNDYHGHLQGDFVLQEIARILTLSFSRGNDFIIRYGGEEFLIVLQGSPVETAEELLERCFGKIRQRQFVHERNPGGYLSVSGGLSSLHSTHAASFQNLVKLAEEALSEAKSAGKNRFNRY